MTPRQPALCAAVLVAALLYLGTPGAAGAAAVIPEPGLEFFERGVAKYRAGDYASALYLFQAARAEGNRNPNLSYDIALTLYRLGRDDEARAAFENLAFEPGFESIAEYHLGLLAARAGDRDAAATSLRRTAEGSEHAPLRQLAVAALAQLGGLLPRASTAVYAALGAGYDSNAGYQPDDLQDVADSAAGFVEGVGVVDRPIGSGYYVLGSVFAREYTDATAQDYSQQSGQLALRGETGGRRWQASLTGRLETTFLGGESLHDAGTLALEGRRAAGPGYLIARMAATRFAAGDVYAELEGWRHRAGLEFATSHGAVGYELEVNERADLDEGQEFASRSPVRHQVSLRRNRPVSGRLSLELRGRYRYSNYGDADRFFADGALQELRRKDSLAEVQLGARWRLARQWSLLMEARYARNSSTIDSYAYGRTSGLVSFEMTL
jgi:hypothetical protein